MTINSFYIAALYNKKNSLQYLIRSNFGTLVVVTKNVNCYETD